MKLNLQRTAIICLCLFINTQITRAQSAKELEQLLKSDSVAAKSAKESKKKSKENAPKKEEPKQVATSKPTATPVTTKVADDDPSKLSWKKNRKLGDKLYKQGSYYNAATYYQVASSKKPKKIKLVNKVADAEFQIRDYKSAERWYKMAVTMDSSKNKFPQDKFYYALCLKYNAKYEEAKEAFQKFNRYAKDDDDMIELKKRSKREAMGCDKGINYRDSVQKHDFKVTHMNEVVNQPFTDFSPFMRDTRTLYFGAILSDKVIPVNGKQKLAAYSKIYTASRDGKNWDKGTELPQTVNKDNFHQGNESFSKDGNTMYYTQCLQDDKLKMRCDIYRSDFANGAWGEGKKLDSKINDPAATNTHPCLGKNEKGEEALYFSSDRNPNKGMDIFYATINPDGSYGRAKTVGSAINTHQDEVTPFFDYSTNTLYFSSNGHINIGGMDVYKTTWDKSGEWMEPENLGTPVNSSVDDWYFTINDKKNLGFVVSNRPGGFGLKSETCCDDIYQVEAAEIALAVRGNVINEQGDARVPSTDGIITLYNDNQGREISTYQVTEGYYVFGLKPETHYKLVSRKEGFEEAVITFNTDGKTETDTMQYDLFLKKKMVPADTGWIGRKIGTVYWEFDKFQLRKDAPDTLNKVVKIMLDHKDLVLEVGSHTDSRGTEGYNDTLSKRRNDGVLRYLMYKKVPKIRVEEKSYGKHQPVAPNTKPDGSDDSEGRQLNRRTEFKVVDKLK